MNRESSSNVGIRLAIQFEIEYRSVIFAALDAFDRNEESVARATHLALLLIR